LLLLLLLLLLLFPFGAVSKETSQVHIDKTTTIPLELYWELIRAGERAKERGQHQLTKVRDGI